ncbi:MAG: Uma2 family endonuclease [Acidobacteriota bacterium]
MASTPTRLMTVAEFEAIPNPPGARYELHHGELVEVGYPKHRHVRIQRQLRRLLEEATDETGVVHTEMPYRPLPENECWGADVAYLSKARWDLIGEYLDGVPDLVVEVLSPSNTASEMLDKRQLCLEHGAKEFWIVDPDRRQVEVSTPDGRVVPYKIGQRIPLRIIGSGTTSLSVEEIFA